MTTISQADFWSFCKERENIRILRAQGNPRPWTDDPILHQFKFTKINREHDKGTVMLKQAIAESPACRSSYESVIHFVSMYRFLGSPLSFLKLVDFTPEERNQMTLDNYEKGYPIMKMTAYQISVPLGKSPITLACSLWPRLPERIHRLPKPTGMLSVRAIIGDYTKEIGYNSCWFHGMEIGKDLSMLFPRQYDPQSHVALGPGATAGIARLKYDGEDNLEAFYRLQNMSLTIMPMTLSVLEHAFCEFNKYCEAKFEGKTSRIYTPSTGA